MVLTLVGWTDLVLVLPFRVFHDCDHLCQIFVWLQSGSEKDAKTLAVHHTNFGDGTTDTILYDNAAGDGGIHAALNAVNGWLTYL